MNIANWSTRTRTHGLDRTHPSTMSMACCSIGSGTLEYAMTLWSQWILARSRGEAKRNARPAASQAATAPRESQRPTPSAPRRQVLAANPLPRNTEPSASASSSRPRLRSVGKLLVEGTRKHSGRSWSPCTTAGLFAPDFSFAKFSSRVLNVCVFPVPRRLPSGQGECNAPLRQPGCSEGQSFDISEIVLYIRWILGLKYLGLRGLFFSPNLSLTAAPPTRGRESQ